MKKILAFVALVFVVNEFSNGQIIRYVTSIGAGSKDGSTWSNAYDNAHLQFAINKAGIAQVWVAAGTYYPTANGDRGVSFNMNNGVAIYGGFAGTETSLDERNILNNVTILSGDIGIPGDNSDNSYHVLTNSGLNSSAILDGFTIQGGHADGNSGGGIYNVSSTPGLSNLTIIRNYADYGGGVYNYASSPIMTNCLVIFNSTLTIGGGMFNNSLSAPTMTNCTLLGNSAAYGGGMYNVDSSTPNLYNTIIWDNTATTTADQVFNGGTMTLNYCCYANETGDVYVDSKGAFTPDANCITTNPRFVDPHNDFRIAGNSPCADTGNNALHSSTTDIRGAGFDRKLSKIDASIAGTIDMGAYEFKKGEDPDVPTPFRIYVKSNASGLNNGTGWANAYTSLSSAITAAGQYYEIWVAAGTYKPTAIADRNISFNMKNDVAIYGGFAGTETLLSDRNWASNVTILSGDIGIPGDNTDNSYHVVSNSGLNNTAILDGFTIQGGNAADYGGGIYNVSSLPILTNLNISGNYADRGAGISNNNNSSPTLINCAISGNSATTYGGGVYNDGSSPTLSNCLIINNSAIGYGGGIYNSLSSPTLTNCTVAKNSASYGGGIRNGNSSPVVINNSIIWGNIASTSDNQLSNYASTTTINYSCYAAGTGDISNNYGTLTANNCINSDPKFLALNGNDFRIAVTSPCADAGDDSFNSSMTDIRGGSYGRKLDKATGLAGIIDMGAFEFNASLDYITWTGATNTNWNTDGNWSNNLIPTALDNAFIPNVANNPVINEIPATPAVCRNLTIQTGAVVTVAPGKVLEVHGTLTNNAGITGLVIQSSSDASDGTGVLINSTADVIGTVERYVSGDIWHLISPSATAGETVASFVGATQNGNVIARNGNNYALSTYLEATGLWDYYKVSGTNTSGLFGTPAKGFQVLRTTGAGTGKGIGGGNGKLTFKGTLAATDQNITITKTSSGWNLIGNPYPCALDIDAFLSANRASIDPSYFFAYVTKVGDVTTYGYDPASGIKLSSGEGFFVKSFAGGETIHFTTAMKSLTSDAYKGATLGYPTIKLTAEDGYDKLYTIVQYVQGSTTGLDPGRDAGLYKDGSLSFSLFTRLIQDNGVDFTIQALPDNNYENMVIPVGVVANKGSNIIFRATVINFPANYKVTLEDKLTNTFTNLSDANSSYTVNLVTKLSGTGRFYLHTNNIISGLEDQVLIGKLTAYAKGNAEIRVVGVVGDNARATLYNSLGQVVLYKQLNSGGINVIGLPDLSSGVYALQVKDQEKVQTMKVLIRK